MFFNVLNSQGFLVNKQKVSVPVTTTTQIFAYTGSDQTFNIPSNITGTVNIKCWGAGGATQGYGGVQTKYPTGYGGGGGYTEANFTQASMSGKTLTIIVGQGGETKNSGVAAPNTYGGGGGQNQTDTNWGAASGGGRSAVRLPGSIEIITAGGGGGGGGALSGVATTNRGAGGAGGGSTGQDGEYNATNTPAVVYKGTGGTQGGGGTAGGCSTGNTGNNGSQYQGGGNSTFGAGGGGGYYGGGAGGISSPAWIFGGGGGGSSYVSTTYGGTQVYMLQGSSRIVAGTSYFPSGYTSATIGSGGVASNTNAVTSPTNPGVNGLPGLVVITYTA